MYKKEGGSYDALLRIRVLYPSKVLGAYINVF
jgi:hypothetical protein